MQEDFDLKYKDCDVDKLPKPVQGVPMNHMEHEYKTYWTSRWNQHKKDLINNNEIVYLIHADTFSKIGLTKGDIKKRLSTLNTGRLIPVTLVTTYPPKNISYRELERRLHKTYKDLSLGREWFRTEISKEDFLQQCLNMDK